MICPACGAQLTALGVEGMVIDVCRGGCGGLWFDNFELEKMDDWHERIGDSLLAIEVNPHATIVTGRRTCPRCLGVVMMQHRFRPDKPVMVDECPGCGGVWLDGGELAEIRRPAPTKEDRTKAAHRFLERLFIEDLARLKTSRAARRAGEADPTS
jgi:Zn-finger nucleic acid-binding protein